MSEPQSYDTGSCVIGSSDKSHPAHIGYLCRGHVQHLANMLRDIEDQAALLDTRPSMAISNGSGGGSLASHRSPARLDAIVSRDPRRGDVDLWDYDLDPWALDDTASVLGTLHNIGRMVREERHITPPDLMAALKDSLTSAAPDATAGDELREAIIDEDEMWALLMGHLVGRGITVNGKAACLRIEDATAIVEGILPALRDVLAERDRLRAAEAELAERVAQVRRVRELHTPDDGLMGELCCRGCASHVTFTRWPCKTIQALDAS